MHSVYIDEVDKDNQLVGKSSGLRLAIIPRIGELYIHNHKIYNVITVTHDLDSEEHIVYLIVRYIRDVSPPQDQEKPLMN